MDHFGTPAIGQLQACWCYLTSIDPSHLQAAILFVWLAPTLNVTNLDVIDVLAKPFSSSHLLTPSALLDRLGFLQSSSFDFPHSFPLVAYALLYITVAEWGMVYSPFDTPSIYDRIKPHEAA